MKWNPTLAIGHPVIDQQLHQISQLLEILLDHQDEGINSDAVSHLFSRLNHLLADHFGLQEALIGTLDMPKHERHHHCEAHFHILESLSLWLYEATFGRTGSLQTLLTELDQKIHQHMQEFDLPLRTYLFAENQGDEDALLPLPA